MKHRITAVLALLCSAVVLVRAIEYPTMKLGTPCPDFTLPGVDGRNYSPKDFADGKLLAIIFTCCHCPTGQLTACMCGFS